MAIISQYTSFGMLAPGYHDNPFNMYYTAKLYILVVNFIYLIVLT